MSLSRVKQEGRPGEQREEAAAESGGAQGDGERRVNWREVLEGDSTIFADGLTTDILIIFYYKNNAYSSFQCLSQPGTLQIFHLWPGALAPKAFCTVFLAQAEVVIISVLC